MPHRLLPSLTANHLFVALRQVLEVVAETEAPLISYEELLEGMQSEYPQAERHCSSSSGGDSRSAARGRAC